MDPYKDLEMQQTKLPSHLADLLGTDDVLLVLPKGNESIGSDLQNTMEVTSVDISRNLTGNPLQMEFTLLAADATIVETKEKKEGICLNLAREFMNHFNESNNEEMEKMVVCICNGEDQMHTVMLTAFQLGGNFVRMIAFADECITEPNSQSNLNHLLNYHRENVGVGQHKVDVQVLQLQQLYGHKLFNYDLDKVCKNVGSVEMEISWNTLQCNIPENGAVIKLMLQVIVGHADSIIHSLFQELQFLQYCLDELSDNKNFEHVHLSSDPMNSEALYQSICDIVRSVRVINFQVDLEDNVFDVDKGTNFTDKLWNVFKRCANVNELSVCFQKLFEIIVTEPFTLQLFEDDRNSMLGEIIHDICSGVMTIIPHMSLKQCLELLTELGLQKLKKNYFAIIESFNFQLSKTLQDKWELLLIQSPQTRRFTNLNVPDGVTRLNFLYQIHSAIEFLPLLKEKCSFPQGVHISVLKAALHKYVLNTAPHFCYGARHLCDIIVPISLVDVKDYESLSISNTNKRTIRMSSNEKNSSVTTSFYYTKIPLFPATSYKYKDINNCATQEYRFYVTRLESYCDRI